MARLEKSTYEKAVKAKEKRGEVTHFSRMATMQIDVCVTNSLNNRTKYYSHEKFKIQK